MSVDTYAICPCGSGKKIKFCKCKDSVGELDRVMKMVEGGQTVPALDRLATILQEHPDAAWALAIRGRLLLDLREFESLTDNADRFIRLQPSNPLALTQRAAAQLFGGDVEASAESLLESLSESGRDVDSFVLDIASAVSYALAQRGVFLSARAFATLSMMAMDYEGGSSAVSVLRQLNTAPTVNQLLKSIPAEIGRPADVDWAERYDEAASLLHSNKILLAQSKFESLQRTCAGQPAILSGLLTCAIWRADVDSQSQLMKKLSECESLDFEERVCFRAISALVQSEMPELAVEVNKLVAEIEKIEEIEMAFSADSRFVGLPADVTSNMRLSDDDVPPRAGFQCLDRDKPDSTSSLPSVDEMPEAIATIFIYGKQTDRAARIEAYDIRAEHVEDVSNRIQSAIGEQELKQESGDPLPLIVACQPPLAMIRFQAKPVEAEALQAELTRARMPAAIATAKMPILGGNSLLDLADDESQILARTVVVRVVEQYDNIVSKGDNLIDEVYKLAKIDPLPLIKLADDQVESLDNMDLNRVDPSGLSPESLLYLVQRAQQISATPAVRVIANQLIAADLKDEQRSAKLVAYISLINTAERTEAALGYLEEAKAFALESDLSIANLLLSEVGLRLQVGDAAGFKNAIESLSTRYGNDPEIMAQLQQLMMAYGLIGPDGAPRMQPGAPAPGGPPGAAPQAAPAAGLWTPDGGGGGGAPPAQPAPDDGKKLWIPGME